MDDYTDVGLVGELDDPLTKEGFAMLDPLTFQEQLSKIPKLTIISTDDEYMMMDWSKVWSDDGFFNSSYGENHLMIAKSDHSPVFCLTGGCTNMVTFARSIAEGKTRAERPSFTTDYTNVTGEVTVNVTGGNLKKVVLHYARTHSSIRRDFRWLRMENNRTEACVFPEIRIPNHFIKKSIMGGNCISILAIHWHSIELAESATEPNVYKALPPDIDTLGDKWVGYFIELTFDADNYANEPFSFPRSFSGMILKDKYYLTTPAYVWPDELPFEDCDSTKGTCLNQLV
jgi:hypothetical protein